MRALPFPPHKDGKRVGGKLASLISSLIDCEKFEDDILRKPGGQNAALIDLAKTQR